MFDPALDFILFLTSRTPHRHVVFKGQQHVFHVAPLDLRFCIAISSDDDSVDCYVIFPILRSGNNKNAWSTLLWTEGNPVIGCDSYILVA